MGADGREMVFWGWGRPEGAVALPEHALAFLRAELGLGEVERPPVSLQDVRVREPALPEGLRERLVEIVGADGVRDDLEARVLRAAGKSYPDLVRQRSGACESAPDAVVAPTSHEQVLAVLGACAAARVAVVPFGGGTSVVGGVEPLREPFEAVVSLDLGRMDRVLGIDERSLTVRVEPGLRLPELDERLAARGLTLSHVPQSYEHASVGGSVVTRSAGQSSTGFGRIDELVLGLRLAAPAGELELPPLPRNAAGPDLRELVAGSEGVLGVLTEVALRVRRLPAARRYEGWFFRSFPDGVEALRELEQRDEAPDISRLSDQEETRLSLALAGEGGLKTRLGKAVLAARGYAGGSLAIVGWEGESEIVPDRRARAARILRRHGGMPVGRSAGERWLHQRFAGPYLRDDMLRRGVMVETLETAAQWSALSAVYHEVADALRQSLAARGTPPLVMCHVSHLYPSGASLYFTFMARQQQGEELEQWRAAKTAACEAIVRTGATITHHHAVGTDHAPYVTAEKSVLGMEALRAAKAALDPVGIMNPGKLLGGRPESVPS